MLLKLCCSVDVVPLVVILVSFALYLCDFSSYVLKLCQIIVLKLCKIVPSFREVLKSLDRKTRISQNWLQFVPLFTTEFLQRQKLTKELEILCRRLALMCEDSTALTWSSMLLYQSDITC